MKKPNTDARTETVDSVAAPKYNLILGMHPRMLLIIAIDIFCFVSAYLLNGLVCIIIDSNAAFPPLSKWPNLLLLLAFVMGGRFLLSVYRNIWRYPNVRAYLTMVVADGSCGIMGVLLSYLLARLGIEAFFIDIWQAVSILALFDLVTLVIRFAYQLYHQRKNHIVPVADLSPEKADGKTADTAATGGPLNKIGIAIVGAGQVGFHLAEELRNSPRAHYHPVCFIDKDPNKVGMHVSDLKVYAEDEHIIDILRTLPIQEIFVAIPGLPAADYQRIITSYTNAGYKVKNYDFPSLETRHALADQTTARRVVREFRIEELLGRESLDGKIDDKSLRNYYTNRVVLVTGGGGSIGSEICRQIASYQPKQLIILDIYENNAYEIQQELLRQYGDRLDLVVEIASVRDVKRLDCIFRYYRPEVVFHAAAHKHVPLMEHSSCEVIKNNVMGTYNTANMAEKYGVEKFVLISTDKAVNPTNIMGASKRMCEMVVQCRRDSKTSFASVRFGNVLGSNGSVIPLFRKQIEAGGPVTVTSKKIVRYFMTIPEASRLVLTAGSMAQNGELFVLNMGKPVSIWALAENMVRMMGMTPGEDIQIVETELRPGEKLYEEMLIKKEISTQTANELIYIETDKPYTREEIEEKLARLNAVVKEAEDELASPRIKEVMREVVPTFHDAEEVNSNASQAPEMKSAVTSKAYAGT